MENADLNSAMNWISKKKMNYIGGEWKEARGDVFQVTNPATLAVLGEYKMANEGDVEEAVTAALQCFDSGKWHKSNMRERARTLRQIGQLARDHHAELALLESLPNGKTYREAYNDDLPDCSDVFDYYAGWVDKNYGDACPVEDGFLNYTREEPLGVCAQIVPWNFPLLMALWKMAPALATGNCVVIKPSEYTPYSLIRFFELIDEKIDLPPGLINLVIGNGETGGYLTSHPNVHKVSFTGSTKIGKDIVEKSGQSNLKSVSLELGGKSPNIFFEDTPHLDQAIERSFHLIFSQKGEKCSEPTRFLIHESLVEKISSRLVEMAGQYKIGDPLDSKTDQGAQANKSQFEKILHYVELGKKEGAKLAFGGERARPSGFEDGYFVQPTIFTDVTPDMSIFQDEIFGPVLSISSFSTDQEAIDLANNTKYGLAAGLWTKDISRAHRVAEQIDAGMIFINRYGCYEFSSPFGGFRQSGWGKEMGKHSLKAYTKTKSIWVAL